MRFALFLMVTALAGCAAATSRLPADLTGKLVGIWGETGPEDVCRNNPATITFTRDGKYMIVARKELGCATETDCRKSFRYRILGHTDSYIRVAMEGETRLDADGKPVVWHIVPLDRNTFCWGRDDWPKGACTPSRQRCGT